MQAHDRPCVALVDVVLIQASFSSCSVIPVRLVNIAFFRSNHKRGCLVVREVERGNGHLPGFVVTGVDELKGFLPQWQRLENTKTLDKLART